MIDEKEHGGVMEIDKELMTKIYDLRRRLHSLSLIHISEPTRH